MQNLITRYVFSKNLSLSDINQISICNIHCIALPSFEASPCDLQFLSGSRCPKKRKNCSKSICGTGHPNTAADFLLPKCCHAFIIANPHRLATYFSRLYNTKLIFYYHHFNTYLRITFRIALPQNSCGINLNPNFS